MTDHASQQHVTAASTTVGLVSRRTCSLFLERERGGHPAEPGDVDLARAVVVEHEAPASPVSTWVVRRVHESSWSTDAARALEDARAWARRRDLVVVDYRRLPSRVRKEGGYLRLAVGRALPDGRFAALEMGVLTPCAETPSRHRSLGQFLWLHVEDPAGVPCPLLEPRRCDERHARGACSVLHADRIYALYGDVPGTPEQGEEAGLVWHAMAAVLYAWTAGLPARDVFGTRPAVSVLDRTPVSSVEELRAKYGVRGISLLVERCVDLLPALEERDDLVTRLGVAVADLESVLLAAPRSRP